MSAARPVRIARTPAVGVPSPGFAGAPEAVPPLARPRPRLERRENSGATRRAVRLSLVFTIGILGVYLLLLLFSQLGPAAGSAGTEGWLLVAGLLAVVVGAVGVIVALGTAPRAVEVGEAATVVVGRFGRRYHFPGRERLQWNVLQRTPSGVLSPVPLELVELAGGSSRRSFLLDEGLLASPPEGDGPPP